MSMRKKEWWERRLGVFANANEKERIVRKKKNVNEKERKNDEKEDEESWPNWSTDKLARLPNGHLSHSSTPTSTTNTNTTTISVKHYHSHLAGQLTSQVVKCYNWWLIVQNQDNFHFATTDD